MDYVLEQTINGPAGSTPLIGAHYPGDVVGGAVIGIGVALAITHLVHVIPEKLTDFADAVLRRLHVMSPETPTG